MLNALRSLFASPVTAEELAFRERVLRYAERRELSVQCDSWSRADWLGEVVADVFLQAQIDRHVKVRLDLRTVAMRAAFGCYGLCRRTGVRTTLRMIEIAMTSLGAQLPTRKSLLEIVRQALDHLEEKRIWGALDEQPEEVMVPRYVAREEPLVLQSLAAGLERQLWAGREKLSLPSRG